MFRIIISVSVVFELFLLVKVQCKQPVIRQTQNGPIEGHEQVSALNQRYYSFLGIPYAEAPITGVDPYTGEKVDRRFKAPEALKRNWTIPLKAYYYGHLCVTAGFSETSAPELMREDCLFLNIFVPVGGASLKTTMIYIHGGGFSRENSTNHNYGPDFLLSQDNIVVTIGYRLGIFGFLNLGHDDYGGNMGLKDQQMAIKWIYENIENFSGKKDEILLFGQSSGGVSVQLHMLNEQSRKYFTRAYSISGSAFQFYSLRVGNLMKYIQNCSGTNETAQLMDYLKTANTRTLADCYVPGKGYPIWVPHIENSSSKRPFLNQKLVDIFNSDKAPVMDTMFSFASQESIEFRPQLLDQLEPLIGEDLEKTDLYLPFVSLTKWDHPKEYKWAVKKLRDAYFTNTSSVDAIKRANIALYSDLYLVDAIMKSIVLQINANNRGADESQHRKTFLFRYSINADLSLNKILSRSNYTEAAHQDERCYIFYCRSFDSLRLYDQPLQRKDTNYDIIMRFVKIITNFARFGDPSIEGDTPFKSCSSSNEIFCQEMSNEPRTFVTNNIKAERHHNLWREIEKVDLEIGEKSGNKADRLGQGTVFIFVSFHVFLLNFMNSRISFC